MCSLFAYDKIKPDHKDDKISIGDRPITDNATPKALEALGTNINFIDIWLKLFLENYDALCVSYINATKEIFKGIPLTIKKPLNPKKSQETHDRYWLWVVNGKRC